ncbi:HTTM domain-containing protein [Halorubrum coriense DSM 10284]|uniref:HTTM domain-containing protein n=1 Tax=Halorubrum coriense DSM 10284 TaxID=1227466 RepID=M0EWK3_9EURY|nr:HTTM domain-containing protein [Halorubrum coriense]ELZ50804.1 HTTM domain-containing protein [Halorubrum coriense DSM 10284]
MNGTRPDDTARSRVAALVGRLSTALAARVAVDRRALAAFRIGLGAVLLADLAARSRSLTAFYTDAGVLPRRALFADYAGTLSVHALVGEPWAVALVFAVAGAVALALCVGYRTRLATAASWLLLLSLHARNPMVLNAGDDLLLALLFWSLFLPLGARWSVDAVRGPDARDGREEETDLTADGDAGVSALDATETAVANVAAMAVLAQVLVMYLTNAVHKFESELWMSGEAVVYVMQADQFSYLLGDYLAAFTPLLRAFTVLWVALLFASPLLLLLTGFPRAVLASLFVGMHLGMAVTIRVGLFPVVVVVGFLPFFQTPVWDVVARVVDRLNWARGVASWRARCVSLARRLNAVDAALPRPVGAERLAALRSGGLARGRVLFTTVLPYAFLVLILLSSAASVGYAEVPDPAEDALDTVEMTQSWQMFAPDPIHTTRWIVAVGALEDGTERDVYRDAAVTFDRPDRAETTYRTSRWRKYLKNVDGADNENHRSYLANYLCGDWNRTHETDVETVTIYRGYERTNPYNGTVEAADEYELIEYDCSGEFIQNE